jgi:aryl-alcohol dehydrogenase-like predicted oxidoreductase
MRMLGRNGPIVSRIGLGCMGMSAFYGPADRAESIATIHASMDAGVTLLDTGDFYGMGHNELLLREALAGGRRDDAFIQVKFGAQRDPKGAFLGFNARPEAVKSYLGYTLQRLGTDYIDLYQPARLDPAVPIEDTVGAIADMVKAGYVRHIGLSEMGAHTIRRAHAVHPIAALQIEYALVSRGIEADILPTLRELGISVTAYGVLSRGLLAGTGARQLHARDFRVHGPRWQGDNLKQNLTLADELAKLARELHATPVQLAIAWVLSRGEDIIPLIGARTRAQLKDALGVLHLRVSPADLERVGQVISPDKVAGTRYDAAQMAVLDSERKAPAG